MANDSVYDLYLGILRDSIKDLCSKPEILAKRPGIDFTRNRSLPPDVLIEFFLSAKGSALKKITAEFLHNRGMESLSYQAFAHQRSKLAETAMPYLFDGFNRRTRQYDTATYLKGYILVGVDGTGLTTATNREGLSYLKVSDSNQFHITALYDISNQVYIDLDVRTASKQYEVQSSIQMIEKNTFRPKTIILGDRAYGSFNHLEHLNRKGLKYVIRYKDDKSIWEIDDLPNMETDRTVICNIHTTQTKEDLIAEKQHKSHRLVGKSKFGKPKKNVTWDFEPHAQIKIRLVKFQLDDGKWEVLATNLTEEEFSIQELKEMYHERWKIETSFLHLKYNIGLINLHSRKEEYVVQEIYASFTAFNFCQRVTRAVARTMEQKQDRKYQYYINISQAFFLLKNAMQHTVNRVEDIERTILRYLIPIKPGRHDRRKEHKPNGIASCLYRVA